MLSQAPCGKFVDSGARSPRLQNIHLIAVDLLFRPRGHFESIVYAVLTEYLFTELTPAGLLNRAIFYASARAT